VHDDNSVYTLDEKTITLDSNSTDVQILSGTTNTYFPDTITKMSKKEMKNEDLKTIHVYLTEDAERQLEDGGSIDISQKDIQKVRMNGRKHTGAMGIVLGVLGAALGIFLLLVLLLVIILLAAANGSGGSTSNSEPSCYVATMVYGSTEAPEVIALRRFRDQYLLPNKYGRAFVKWYYSNSPNFVAKFQDNVWVNKILKSVLNIFVKLLKSNR
jgi:hypothetical protein